MTQKFNRRSFLKTTGAGLATLSMPRFLSGCATQGAGETARAAHITSSIPDNPFLNWFGVDGAIIQKVMGSLTSRGATTADLFFQYRRSHSISLEDGIISKASSSIDEGVGLRTVIGDQTGYAFTEELTLDSMNAAAETAASIAQGKKIIAPQSFSLSTPSNNLYTIQVPWSEVGIERKIPLLRKLESMIRAQNSAIEKVQIYWNDYEDRILIADARGHLHTDVRPMTRLWCLASARKNGKVQSGSANISGRHGIDWYSDERLQELAKQVADRTMILFDARQPPAGELPVILAAGASGILLHEAIGHGMEADFNRKGTSIYSDMIGKPVAPEFVTMIDSGQLPNERGSLNFDDEGNPCTETLLVEKGILRSYLHDSISARHYNLTPTGSGRRETFRHVPMPRMRCTYMEDGPHTKEEIIASVKKGIIAETFTNGQVKIGAGDYTFYIKNGWLVEDGKITAPIKDCNIIGNGPESLKNITMAANDAKLDTGGWTCGKSGQSVPVSIGLPTVLVSQMTVGGNRG